MQWAIAMIAAIAHCQRPLFRGRAGGFLDGNFFYHLDALFGPTPDGSLCFALPDILPVRLCTRKIEKKGEGGKGGEKRKSKKGERKKSL